MLRKQILAVIALALAIVMISRAEARFQDNTSASPSPEGSPLACATPVSEGEGTPILTVTAPAVAGSPDASPSGEVIGLYPCGTPVGTPEGGGMTTGQENMDAHLEAIDIAFAETEIRIPANTDAHIIFTNTGVLPHNFTVEELGIRTSDLATGASETVTINAPAGTYKFICSVPGHADAGMVGTLIVE